MFFHYSRANRIDLVIHLHATSLSGNYLHDCASVKMKKACILLFKRILSTIKDLNSALNFPPFDA